MQTLSQLRSPESRDIKLEMDRIWYDMCVQQTELHVAHVHMKTKSPFYKSEHV